MAGESKLTPARIPSPPPQRHPLLHSVNRNRFGISVGQSRQRERSKVRSLKSETGLAVAAEVAQSQPVTCSIPQYFLPSWWLLVHLR